MNPIMIDNLVKLSIFGGSPYPIIRVQYAGLTLFFYKSTGDSGAGMKNCWLPANPFTERNFPGIVKGPFINMDNDDSFTRKSDLFFHYGHPLLMAIAQNLDKENVKIDDFPVLEANTYQEANAYLFANCIASSSSNASEIEECYNKRLQDIEELSPKVKDQIRLILETLTKNIKAKVGLEVSKTKGSIEFWSLTVDASTQVTWTERRGHEYLSVITQLIEGFKSDDEKTYIDLFVIKKFLERFSGSARDTDYREIINASLGAVKDIETVSYPSPLRPSL